MVILNKNPGSKFSKYTSNLWVCLEIHLLQALRILALLLPETSLFLPNAKCYLIRLLCVSSLETNTNHYSNTLRFHQLVIGTACDMQIFKTHILLFVANFLMKIHQKWWGYISQLFPVVNRPLEKTKPNSSSVFSSLQAIWSKLVPLFLYIFKKKTYEILLKLEFKKKKG